MSVRPLSSWIELAEKIRANYRVSNTLYFSLHNFQVGQKVVCINECAAPGHPCTDFPQMGQLYTIRIVCPDLAPDGKYHDAVQLEELCNPNSHPELGIVGETWFSEFAFMPMAKKKADATAVTKALANVTARVR